ncbi:hypothetical protein SGRIM128S_00966 [Streptomyces griseomycini]
MPAPGSALRGRSEQLGAIPGNRGGGQPAQAEDVQPRVERGLRRRVDRTIAEKRPRRGVRDYGEHQVGDRVLARLLQGDHPVPAVRLTEQLAHDLAHVQRVGGPPAALPLLLHPADHAGVEAQSRVEGEPAGRYRLVLRARGARGQTQAHGALAALAQRVQQGAGGLHGLVGQPQGAGEDVGGAAGDHGEPGQVFRIGSGVQETVDDLVDRAVAAEGHDQVDVVALRRLPAQVARVPAVLGGDRLQLHLTGERVDQYVARARTRGGCRRIDHKKCTHDVQGTYWAVPGPDRGADRAGSGA